MRQIGAALLGLLVPGTGHLLTGRRRDAAIFLVPLAVLVGGVVAVASQGGIYGLLAFVVTPGVLPALAILNIALAAWRLLAGIDVARLAPPSRTGSALLGAAALLLVVVPHVILGRTIASTSDFLDSLFAPSGTAVAMDDEDPGIAFGTGDYRWMVAPTDAEIAPGWSPDAAEEALPTPTPTPVRRTGGGGGNTADPLPPLGAAVPWQAPGAVPWGNDGRFDLLLMGSDAGSDRWSRRMDVMLLVEVDVATGETAMIGLPRNLFNAPFPPGAARDAVPCGCLQALLNEAYYEAVWNHPDRWPGTGSVKGIGAVRGIVSELTGRPIDAVLVADLMGVVRVVDAMGGVDVNVPYSVYDDSYPDPVVGDTTLYIRSGLQHMDGRLALAYARSRHQDSDYGRMERQQILLLAIRAGLGPATILQAPDLVTAAKGAAWTDLPRESLPNLVQLFGRAAGAPVHQLRLVPPTYPEWLTATVIAKIRQDVAGLLGPVSLPAPTPTPSPTLPPSPAPSASPRPSSSAAPSPSGSSGPSPGSSPSSGPSPSGAAATAPPSPTPTPTPVPS